MPPTSAATDQRHLHRFAPEDGDVIVVLNTMAWCRCGEQHPASYRVFLCTRSGCGFLLTMPLEGS